jgi:hypothetical protein
MPIVRNLTFNVTKDGGYTEVTLDNGDMLRVKTVVLAVQQYIGERTPDGHRKYNAQTQLVSAVVNSDGQPSKAMP